MKRSKPNDWVNRFVDVLIIGGGLAGLRAALATDERLNVVVVTKDKLWESNSSYAQGGIAAVMDADDEFECHIDDTLRAGGGLCDLAAVESVIRGGPQCIDDLLSMNTDFDRHSVNQALVLGREGGHGHSRIVHANGDATGAAVMRAVIDRVHEQPHVEVIEDAFTFDLLVENHQCRGAVVVVGDRSVVFTSKQTILCTGGAGQLYQETTNPRIATADGHAMAYRAGVPMRDMEFMQFHPTVLCCEGACRVLITEAVRGEGARLLDVCGHRFMQDYDSRLELAPRDVVSQAIVQQMNKTNSPHVLLDVRHLDADFIHQRFPGMVKSCAAFGIDVTSDPIPVQPGAHYMIGGATVDLEGRTLMPGLWAAGEVSSSGLHGANRLASNSLLEALVFGASAGKGASDLASESNGRPLVPASPPDWLNGEPSTCRVDEVRRVAIRGALKRLMWQSVGVFRNGKSLRAAIETVEAWQREIGEPVFGLRSDWELQNMLIVASVMIESALAREESRGVHRRFDFPESDERQCCHTSVSRNDEGGPSIHVYLAKKGNRSRNPIVGS